MMITATHSSEDHHVLRDTDILEHFCNVMVSLILQSAHGKLGACSILYTLRE